MAKKTTKSAEEIAAEASKVEMDAKRAEITAYYKDSVKHLKVQLEYETILKDIEAARAERIQAQSFIANAMREQQEAQPETGQRDVNLQKAPQPVTTQAGSDWDANSNQAPPVPQDPVPQEMPVKRTLSRAETHTALKKANS